MQHTYKYNINMYTKMEKGMITFLRDCNLEIHKIYKFSRNKSGPILYIYLFRTLTVCLTNLFICWNNIEKDVILTKYLFL